MFVDFFSFGEKVHKKSTPYPTTDWRWYLTKDHAVDNHTDIMNDNLQPTIKRPDDVAAIDNENTVPTESGKQLTL